jgi:hypothetical protein
MSYQANENQMHLDLYTGAQHQLWILYLEHFSIRIVVGDAKFCKAAKYCEIIVV